LVSATQTGQRGRNTILPVNQDSRHDFSCYTHSRLMSFGRLLYSNVGFVKGAMDDVATFTVGQHWNAQHLGADTKWGEEAAALLNESWYPVCNVMGGPYDWRMGWLLSVVSAMRDCDVLMVLVRLPSGYPQIQFIPAHRIGSRGEVVTKKGPYVGLKCFNGVIYNAWGRTVAYQILADKEADDVYVSARDSYLICSPDWVDQRRGVTSLLPVINDHVDIDDMTAWEKFAAKLFASQTLIETVEGDYIADDAERFGDDTNVAGDEVKLEYFDGGMVRKFKAGTGADVKAFEQDRPTPNWMAFRRELMRGTYAAIRWPIEFAYDPSTINGTAARMIAGKANRTVKHWQRQLLPAARKATAWAILQFMERGDLRWNDEWYRWGFQMPPRLSMDIGREAQQAREDNRMALRTAQDIYEEQSLAWKEEMDQCMDEAEYLMKGCEKRGIPLEAVRNLGGLTKDTNLGPEQDPEPAKTDKDQ
jgi:hypothetical protein